ncbi:hypothetical protein K438DRAFT_1751272 [Mycena galopus ATCC 62051]|nr:hypothetical protein K438DRAFT_1751272 [Mycena galopus ATCC 62051]
MDRTGLDHIPEVSVGFGGPGVDVTECTTEYGWLHAPHEKPKLQRLCLPFDVKKRSCHSDSGQTPPFRDATHPNAASHSHVLLQVTLAFFFRHNNAPYQTACPSRTTWKEIGEVARDRTYIGRAPMLSPAHIKVIHS